MHSVNILDYSVRSSQGDMNGILNVIKSENISCSTKEVNTLDGKQRVPYFLFEDSVADEKQDILISYGEIIDNSVSVKGCVYKKKLIDDIEIAINNVMNKKLWFPKNIEVNRNESEF